MPDAKKYLSKIVKGGNTLWLKDAEARQEIEDIKSSITGAMHYAGVTTTEISDGSTTNPVTIDGKSYTAQSGDVVIYGELEFVFNGTKWQEFGSTGSLKALAFKDTASATYTPAGTNAASVVSFTGTADDDFVTGYNDDGVAASFTEGAFTPASIGEGFYSPGTAPSFTEGAFTPAQIQAGFVTEGTAPSFTEGAFTPASLANGFYTAGTAPSLGAATSGNFATEGEVSEYDETEETLTFSDASTSSAVTAQGTFSAGSVTTLDLTKFDGGSKAADSFSAGAVTVIDTTKFSGGSKAADTFSAGTMASIDTTKFNGGSKAADSFNAGSLPTLATDKAITDLGSAEAAAQVFSGTQATITVS